MTTSCQGTASQLHSDSMKEKMQRHSAHAGIKMFLLLLVIVASAFADDFIGDTLEPWQACDVFMAPTNTTAGWGVFAARDFEKRELLDITPVYIPFKLDSRSHYQLLKSSMLDDYAYGVTRQHNQERSSLVLFGWDMVYNHHPTAFNVQFGMGPGYAQGFYARRDIKAGEQLFSSYGKSDGGKQWFETRSLSMIEDDASIRTEEQLQFLRSQYCSRVYSGPDRSNWHGLIPLVDEARLSPLSSGLWKARAKIKVSKGDRIEKSIGMLMYKPFVDDTALAGLVMSWEHLNEKQRHSLQAFTDAQPRRKIPIQYQGPESQYKRVQRYAPIDQVSILPFAGRIGTLRRDIATANCELELTMHVLGDHGRVGITMELFASRNIAAGEVLVINMLPAGTDDELDQLKKRLLETGQPFREEL